MAGLFSRRAQVKPELFELLSPDRFPQVETRDGAARASGQADAHARRTAPAARRRSGRPGHHPAVDPPGRVLGGRPAGPPLHGHHGHRLGQEPLLQPAGARRAAARPSRPGHLPLPHQGPRPRPAAPPPPSGRPDRSRSPPTTATPPPPRATWPGRRPACCSPTPT